MVSDSEYPYVNPISVLHPALERIGHRTRAPERAVILMVETRGIVPTGD